MKPFKFTVDLGWRTVPCKKGMEPWSDRLVLWPWPIQPVHTVPVFQALNYTVRHSFLFFFFLYDIVWAYGHTRSMHRNPETLKSQSLSHLSSLPFPHCSLSSLISASLSHRHQPPLSAHSVTLSITLCLSHSALSPSATTSYLDRSSLT